MTVFKACPPAKSYYLMEVEQGKSYAWCACGRSMNQPFCDGSHAGSGKTPVAFTAPEVRDVFFCGCKRTKTPPFCDGSHKQPAAPSPNSTKPVA